MLRNARPIFGPCQSGCAINLTQTRTSFYNKYKHGPMRISNPKPPIKKWITELLTTRKALDFIVEEAKLNWKSAFKTVIPKPVVKNQPRIFEHFDSDESIKKWKPVADSDSLNGYSVSEIVRSQAGHALFRGVLDTRVPDDGITQTSGFAAVIGPSAPRTKLVQIDTHWEWRHFNCVELRVRGDGRKYTFVVSTSDYTNDLTYYDTYGYPLYTRGGPYWQTIRIPFSKFIFTHKGLIQDEQNMLPYYQVKFVAIALQDRTDGPFSLEIDYIALVKATMDYYEEVAYEAYSFPHIRYKQLSIGCDPPEPKYE